MGVYIPVSVNILERNLSKAFRRYHLDTKYITHLLALGMCHSSGAIKCRAPGESIIESFKYPVTPNFFYLSAPPVVVSPFKYYIDQGIDLDEVRNEWNTIFSKPDIARCAIRWGWIESTNAITLSQHNVGKSLYLQYTETMCIVNCSAIAIEMLWNGEGLRWISLIQGALVEAMGMITIAMEKTARNKSLMDIIEKGSIDHWTGGEPEKENADVLEVVRRAVKEEKVVVPSSPRQAVAIHIATELLNLKPYYPTCSEEIKKNTVNIGGMFSAQPLII